MNNQIVKIHFKTDDIKLYNEILHDCNKLQYDIKNDENITINKINMEKDKIKLNNINTKWIKIRNYYKCLQLIRKCCIYSITTILTILSILLPFINISELKLIPIVIFTIIFIILVAVKQFIDTFPQITRNGKATFYGNNNIEFTHENPKYIHYYQNKIMLVLPNKKYKYNYFEYIYYIFGEENKWENTEIMKIDELDSETRRNYNNIGLNVIYI